MKRPLPTTGAKPQATNRSYVRKAFYSAAPDGRVVCHRCQAVMAREAMAQHTAVCWPDAGTS